MAPDVEDARGVLLDSSAMRAAAAPLLAQGREGLLGTLARACALTRELHGALAARACR